MVVFYDVSMLFHTFLTPDKDRVGGTIQHQGIELETSPTSSVTPGHSDLSGRKSENNLKKLKIDEKIGISINASDTCLNEAILL